MSLNTSESPVTLPGFQIKEGIRNELGDRIFYFKDSSYKDRQQRELFTSLLISEPGEEVIKKRKGFLQGLNRAVIAIHHPDELLDLVKQRDDIREISPEFHALADRIKVLEDVTRFTQETPYQLPDSGRCLYFLAQGGESEVFVYQQDGEKYIVKYPRALHETHEDLHQPYVNEMLQMQFLQRDLGPEMEKMGVFFPEQYFSSPEALCVQFIEGRTPTEEELPIERTNSIYELVAKYLMQKKSNDPDGLWTNMYVDIYKDKAQRLNNFSITNSGKIYLVDPLAYLEKDQERGTPPKVFTMKKRPMLPRSR